MRPKLSPDTLIWRKKNRKPLKEIHFTMPEDNMSISEFFAFLVVCDKCSSVIYGPKAGWHRQRCLF
jgi:hypothetical protein